MASTKRAKNKRAKSLKQPLPYINIVLSLIFIILGATILIGNQLTKTPLYLDEVNNSDLQPTESQTLSKPTKIYIPRLGRVLYVSDGYIKDSRWLVSETGVSFYTDSALPGQIGNTVIYGHNTRDKLGGLWRVGDGDDIYIVLANGNFVKYQVAERKEIKPTQVEILNQTDYPKLTIYTCSGFLDQARFVISGNLVSI